MDYQTFVEMLTIGPSERRSTVVVAKEKDARDRIASGVVMECHAQSVPVRHTVFKSQTDGGHSETAAFLILAQSNINLPFSWAQQIESPVVRNSYLDCVAALAALVVARARNIQGLSEFARSAVRREWKINTQGGSFARVMDEIGQFVSPAPARPFIASLKVAGDPIIMKSINYLVAGLILLKDLLLLSAQKIESSNAALSVAVIDNASTFMGGYTNSDEFYSSFIRLGQVMGHSLAFMDQEMLPAHVLALINHPKVITETIAIAV